MQYGAYPNGWASVSRQTAAHTLLRRMLSVLDGSADNGLGPFERTAVLIRCEKALLALVNHGARLDLHDVNGKSAYELIHDVENAADKVCNPLLTRRMFKHLNALSPGVKGRGASKRSFGHRYKNTEEDKRTAGICGRCADPILQTDGCGSTHSSGWRHFIRSHHCLPA